MFLDPDGMAGGWLYVIVGAQTGVFYQQQYGGTACRQGQVEGFLVPVFGPDALEASRELFEREFRGTGTWNYSWPEDELGVIVDSISYWSCDGHAEEPHNLRLDETRIREIDEAWVPVITPDDRGVRAGLVQLRLRTDRHRSATVLDRLSGGGERVRSGDAAQGAMDAAAEPVRQTVPTTP